MAHSMRYFATVVLLAMLVMATEMGSMQIAEARTCQSPSRHFKGECLSENCLDVCEAEGFTDGECLGPHFRCICSKPC
ncbi:defensin-like protein P322 [Lycium ferocissimum]|uniref:defensin-like protein P322 n=1 Tax=Lycium ferocissimum TaxID=112874 RepID=UPI0028155CD4|nr:defensin-like protein P322 [Lycium ferocissimum]